MTTRSLRDSLKVELLDAQRMKALVGGHPLMSFSFAQREKEIEEKIAKLPLGDKEARTVLFFSGDPVQGCFGIDAGFAGRVLEPFQNMVMADFADRFHGVVGTRGRRQGEASSRLLLTALPRGSFGLELTRADNDEIFEEDQLADTLAHVTKLVESAKRSDEDFASELDGTAPRVIQNLKAFLEVIANGKAGLRLESGDFRCSMDPIEANEAFKRVSGTVTDQKELKMPGIFKGALLESWRFDFIDENNHTISGKIDDSLTPEQVSALSREYFDRRCVADLIKTTVLFKNGRARTTYMLNNLKPEPG